MTFIKGHKTNLGRKFPPEFGEAISQRNLGKKLSIETREKISMARVRDGIKPPSMKGKKWKALKEIVTYSGIHTFIRRIYGSPKECSNCGLEGRKNKTRWNIHWANVSGKYLRDRADWLALCVSCHKKYDLAK